MLAAQLDRLGHALLGGEAAVRLRVGLRRSGLVPGTGTGLGLPAPQPQRSRLRAIWVRPYPKGCAAADG